MCTKTLNDPLSFDSSEEEYVKPETVIIMLKNIIEKIEKKEFNHIMIQDIHDAVEEFVKSDSDHIDPKNPFDKEIMSYIFKGWWLSQAICRGNTEGVEQKEYSINVCPFCLGVGNSHG